MRELSLATKAYILLIIAAGVFFSVLNYSVFPPQYSHELLLFLILTAIAGIFKVSLPFFGTLSIAYIFVFTNLLVFGVTESIVASIVSSLTASLFNVRKKNPLYRILFNVSATALTSAGAANIFIFMGGSSGTITIPKDLLAVFSYTFAFYVINTFLVSAAISLSGSESIITIWKENYLWTAINYFIAGSSIALLLAHLMQRFNIFLFILSLPIIYISYYSLKLYLSKLEEDKKHSKELADLYLSIIEALAFAIDAKDQTTERHLRRVQNLTLGIAKKMKMEKKEFDALKAAALLHDIGKIAVPEYILNKPGKLSPEEFKHISEHSDIGANILETVKFPYPLGPIVRHHHEKYDGSGYPKGLKGAKIPLGARILAVVDCYDALTTDRPYRKALSQEEVIEHMNREAGKLFDPDVVRIMIDNLAEFDISYNELIKAAKKSKGSDLLPDSSSSHETTGNELQQREKSPVEHRIMMHPYREVFSIYEAIQTLEKSLNTDELFLLMTSKLKRLVHFKCCILFIPDDREKMLVPQHINGDMSQHLRNLKIGFGEKLSGWSFFHNRPFIGRFHVSPLHRDGTRSDLEDLYHVREIADLRNSLAIPLEADGEKLGVLSFYDSEEYENDDLNIMKSLSKHLASAVKNSLMNSRLKGKVYTDLLTGLPSADYFFMVFENEALRAQENFKKIILLRMELFDFEEIKKQYGAYTRKKMLVSAAHYLRNNVRTCDLSVRFGLNEFIVMIPFLDQKDISTLLNRADRSLSEMNLHLPISKTGKVKARLKIGHAIYPDDGETIELLLSRADERKADIMAKEGVSEKIENVSGDNLLIFRKKI